MPPSTSKDIFRTPKDRRPLLRKRDRQGWRKGSHGKGAKQFHSQLSLNRVPGLFACLLSSSDMRASLLQKALDHQC